MERLTSFFGIFVILGVAWLFSSHKRIINWRAIVGGLLIQWALAYFILKTAWGVAIFEHAQLIVNKVVGLSDEGALFMFGANYADHFFAFKVLPTIIFVSSLSALLFHWGILQWVVDAMARGMQKVMGLSGSESLVTAANIFLGQTEAPLMVKPYIKGMTKSEILVMMSSGMASVAGGVLAAYVGMGISAGHLLAASLMSAPACIIISKLMVPETEVSETMGHVRINLPSEDENAFAAACRGASEGLYLALNVGAMLVAFIALVALVNLLLGTVTGKVFGEAIFLQQIFGTIFYPFAFIMGVPLDDCARVGQLIGQRMVLNEFVAYQDLANMQKDGLLSARAIAISTYALCGFANFSSIAIQIGGIGVLEPTKRRQFAQLGFRSMICGTLAGFMTACIAGILL